MKQNNPAERLAFPAFLCKLKLTYRPIFSTIFFHISTLGPGVQHWVNEEVFVFCSVLGASAVKNWSKACTESPQDRQCISLRL